MAAMIAVPASMLRNLRMSPSDQVGIGILMQSMKLPTPD
jgi:hypothetical protein